MQKFTWLVLAAALLGSAAEAGAQEKSQTAPPGFLGIRYDESLTVVNGRRDPSKVVVRDVSKDSPAERAGIRAGDEIVRINGLDARNGKFSAIARTLVEGDTVRLRVKRGDSERDYTIVAAARPQNYGILLDRYRISPDSLRERVRIYLDSARIQLDSLKLPGVWVTPSDSAFEFRIEKLGPMFGDSAFFRTDSGGVYTFRLGPGNEMMKFEGEFGPGMIIRSMELGRRSVAGAEFTELDPAMRPYFKTDRGVLTLRVVDGTPAAKAGLQPGDVIVKANDQTINSVAELRRILLARPDRVKLEILRQGATRTLELQTRGTWSDN